MDKPAMMATIDGLLAKELRELTQLSGDALVEQRQQKYRFAF